MDPKTLCLGALTLGEASGYEIRKLFEEGPFSHFYDTNYGSIYPALGKLLDENLVSRNEVSQDGKPDKKVYAITDDGLKVFRKSLNSKPVRDKIRSESIFMMFFGNFMDDDNLEDVLDGYLKYTQDVVEKLNNLDDDCFSQQRKFVRGMGQTIYSSLAKYMEENRHLLIGSGVDPVVSEDYKETGS